MEEKKVGRPTVDIEDRLSEMIRQIERIRIVQRGVTLAQFGVTPGSPGTKLFTNELARLELLVQVLKTMLQNLKTAVANHNATAEEGKKINASTFFDSIRLSIKSIQEALTKQANKAEDKGKVPGQLYINRLRYRLRRLYIYTEIALQVVRTKKIGKESGKITLPTVINPELPTANKKNPEANITLLANAESKLVSQVLASGLKIDVPLPGRETVPALITPLTKEEEEEEEEEKGELTEEEFVDVLLDSQVEEAARTQVNTTASGDQAIVEQQFAGFGVAPPITSSSTFGIPQQISVGAQVSGGPEITIRQRHRTPGGDEENVAEEEERRRRAQVPVRQREAQERGEGEGLYTEEERRLKAQEDAIREGSRRLESLVDIESQEPPRRSFFTGLGQNIGEAARIGAGITGIAVGGVATGYGIGKLVGKVLGDEEKEEGNIEQMDRFERQSINRAAKNAVVIEKADPSESKPTLYPEPIQEPYSDYIPESPLEVPVAESSSYLTFFRGALPSFSEPGNTYFVPPAPVGPLDMPAAPYTLYGTKKPSFTEFFLPSGPLGYTQEPDVISAAPRTNTQRVVAGGGGGEPKPVSIVSQIFGTVWSMLKYIFGALAGAILFLIKLISSVLGITGQLASVVFAIGAGLVAVILYFIGKK